MRPKKKLSQSFLFTSKLQQILNDQHPLYKLASSIDWQVIEKQLACCYSEDMGRPANATRLMVGLHYLKHTYNESDERTSKIYSQKRDDGNKLYSLDAPEVECISKGKAHKRYEFGCKVSFSITHKNNWITSAAALHGNPYDGHTLSATIARSESNTQVRTKEVYVDRGYRGHDYVGDAMVFKQDGKLKNLTQAIKKKLKRRSAIEPTIGHVKSDNRMDRNYLKGVGGDMINAILAAAGYNMRKLIAAFLYAQMEMGLILQNWLHEMSKCLRRTIFTCPNLV